MIKLFKQKNKKSGFTLVETLIALSIFSVSIIAMMSILGSGIANTNYAKNKIAASYLAQEGIEYVRNIRDNDVLYTSATGKNWATFRDASIASITPPAPTSLNFNRTIQKIIVNPDEVKISSTVSWTQGSGPFSITFSENLFNWVE
ncbi:MAG: prepilin-type N-terminal cleavage/methylation domain-containing protein [Candidatus Nomurabacteria bacterium]|nr:prepilin-type N-terminal cleavage/methylation domain-containing protein [Candidatus Nomurabacteria bacterium]